LRPSLASSSRDDLWAYQVALTYLSQGSIFEENKTETMKFSRVAILFGSLQHVSLTNGVSSTDAIYSAFLGSESHQDRLTSNSPPPPSRKAYASI
jgi:hypothetical protein